MKSDNANLDTGRNVVDDANGLVVRVAGQAVGDDVVFHLPRRLSACFLPVDGFACWALKTSILLGSNECHYVRKDEVLIQSIFK